MSNLSTMTAWHRAQLGTAESPAGSNAVRYNDIYWGAGTQGPNYPWCCAYIDVGFRETGLGDLWLSGGHSAYCPYVVEWARSHGCWVTSDYREGDLLLYDWDGDGVSDHIGYCTAWDGATATAIEGNSGDAVREEHRGAACILGAYRPDYGTEPADPPGETAETPLPTLHTGDTGFAVLALQALLLWRGYSLPRYGADGDFGAETAAAVILFQRSRHLAADGACGEATWAALLS